MTRTKHVLGAHGVRVFALALALSLTLAARPTHVRAFSDAAFFADPALEGGGDGRYFTGSPSDPFSCGACHQAKKTGSRTSTTTDDEPSEKLPIVTLTGLPERFAAGEQYEFLVRWRDAEVSHALTLELVTEDGKHPDVTLPRAEDLPAASRCDRLETSDPAVHTVDVGKRRVVFVEDCGASEARVAFTAPDVDKLYFAMGMVRSNSSGTPDGDGVIEMRRTLVNESASLPSDGCSVARAGGAHPASRALALGEALLPLTLLGLYLRRRKRSSAKLEAHERRQLEREHVFEPDERLVRKTRGRRAQPEHEHGVRVRLRKLLDVFGAQQVRVHRRQLAIACHVAIGRREVVVARPVEARVALCVIAIAHAERAVVGQTERDVRLEGLRNDTPRIDVTSIAEAEGHSLRERVPQERTTRVPIANVGHVLRDAVRRGARTDALATDRDEAIHARLKAADVQRLPRELPQRARPQHLRERDPAAQAALALRKERVACAPHAVHAAHGRELETRVVACQVERRAQDAAVRGVVGLDRVAIAARYIRVLERVAAAGVDLVTRLVDRLGGRGAHVDRCAGPDVDDVARLERERFLHLACDAHAGRCDDGVVVVGAHVRGGRALGQLARQLPTRSKTGERHESAHSPDAKHSARRGQGTHGAEYTRSVPSKSTGARAWQLAHALLASLTLVACYAPDVALEDAPARDAALPFTDEASELLSGESDRDAAPVVCGEDPSPLTRMTLSVRTVSAGGRFRPRNAGAIWIEDAEGKWIKTIERWGERRAKWLTAFNEASGGDVTDALTSATLQSHVVHEVEWDLEDKDGCEVPNGPYVLRLELTDQSRTGENASFPFEKGTESVQATPEDQSVFRDVSLRLD